MNSYHSLFQGHTMQFAITQKPYRGSIKSQERHGSKNRFLILEGSQIPWVFFSLTRVYFPCPLSHLYQQPELYGVVAEKYFCLFTFVQIYPKDQGGKCECPGSSNFSLILRLFLPPAQQWPTRFLSNSEEEAGRIKPEIATHSVSPAHQSENRGNLYHLGATLNKISTVTRGHPNIYPLTA